MKLQDEADKEAGLQQAVWHKAGVTLRNVPCEIERYYPVRLVVRTPRHCFAKLWLWVASPPRNFAKRAER